MELLESIWGFVKANWQPIFLAITWAGIILVAVRRRRDWQRKRFVEQVNFSLNEVVDGTLRLRTLLEDSADRVWLNSYGVRQVRRAAMRTTLEQPFLRLSPKDMSYVKRAVVNVLSERFAPVFVARSLGGEVLTGQFVFGLTWERYGNQRTQKLRVIIMECEGLVTRMAPDHPQGPPDVERPQHRDRRTTLSLLRELFLSRKERLRGMVGVVELGVIKPPPPAREEALHDETLHRRPERAAEIEITPPAIPVEPRVEVGEPQPPPLPGG